MINLTQIHPVSDFVRNYKLYLTRIKETGSPEVLTVNGKAEYVILDAASYEEISAELAHSRFIRAVNVGIHEMKAGRGMPDEEAFSGIRADLDL